jgi:hypothetical protein
LNGNTITAIVQTTQGGFVFFSNPWVVSFVTGLLVFFVTKFFENKSKKKEYFQRIEMANNEIMHSIKSLIVEKKVPSKEIFFAIKISETKKHGLKEVDLYNEFSLSNDLISEIMANSFLSSTQKLEFCNLLKSFKTEKKKKKSYEIIYEPQTIKMDWLSATSIVLGAIASIITFMVTSYDGKQLFFNYRLRRILEEPTYLIAIIIAFVLLGLTIYYFYLSRKIRNKGSDALLNENIKGISDYGDNRMKEKYKRTILTRRLKH